MNFWSFLTAFVIGCVVLKAMEYLSYGIALRGLAKHAKDLAEVDELLSKSKKDNKDVDKTDTSDTRKEYKPKRTYNKKHTKKEKE